jgi:CheY-like chemotaxis protein
MTNQAISSILDYFYNEALMATGTANGDQLLRSIDDVRDLSSGVTVPPGTTEEFDLVPCASGIIDLLNLTSGKRVKRVELNGPPQSLLVTQDRRALEQMLTRVLDGALKLAEESEAHLRLSIGGSENWIKLAFTISDTAIAARVATWLNADPERVQFEDPGEVPLGVALMVAGKRLRALGGAASLDVDSAVSLGLPSHTRGRARGNCGHKAAPDALNVLVAEDNDESFVLTEMALQDQHVWRARDGQDALEMIQNQRFDVIFMDVHMPGMNGYEVIGSMREWETRTGSPRTPMVVLSSDDLETQQRSAAEFGCSGFLKKPLEKWDLMPLLERLK